MVTDENVVTAVEETDASKIIVVLKVSATKEIPKGAGQFPACSVKIPLLYTLLNKKTAARIDKTLPEMLIIFCMNIFLQKNNNVIAKTNCSNTGNMIRLIFIVFFC